MIRIIIFIVILNAFSPVAHGENVLTGTCSFYGLNPEKEKLNNYVAMNIPFHSELLECATWKFPLGSVLKVTNTKTGMSVIVRCTDRGPAKRLHRLIDLTVSAFKQIEDLDKGLCVVSVELIKK